MIVDRDRDLLNEAVSELVRLKGAAEGPTRFLAHLYASALEEWAGRLGMDPLQLNKLVPIGRRCAGARSPVGPTPHRSSSVKPPVRSLWR